MPSRSLVCIIHNQPVDRFHQLGNFIAFVFRFQLHQTAAYGRPVIRPVIRFFIPIVLPKYRIGLGLQMCGNVLEKGVIFQG